MVSVIVPVYNKAKYLRRCIESVLCQNYQDIEVICVNDGSTDNSLEILQEMIKEDFRIKIIDKHNGGVVSARLAGLLEARGEYVGFVDADDYVEPVMYAKLVFFMDLYQVDLVSSGYYLNGNYVTEHLDNFAEGLYKENDMKLVRSHAIYSWIHKETGLRGSLCCKLFRTDIMKTVFRDFPEKLTMAEDKMIILRYVLECKSLYILQKAFYHWVIHPESVSHSASNDYLIKVNEVSEYLKKMYDHPNFTDTMRNQAEIYIVELLTLGINSRMGFKNKNLLRIDPYWLDYIPVNTRIITYGGADLLEQYKIQLKQRSDILVIRDLGFDFPRREELNTYEYDYILITIKNKSKADSVRKEFMSLGVEEEKILWFEQPEFYWKYAKAQGLLEE